MNKKKVMGKRKIDSLQEQKTTKPSNELTVSQTPALASSQLVSGAHLTTQVEGVMIPAPTRCVKPRNLRATSLGWSTSTSQPSLKSGLTKYISSTPVSEAHGSEMHNQLQNPIANGKPPQQLLTFETIDPSTSTPSKPVACLSLSSVATFYPTMHEHESLPQRECNRLVSTNQLFQYKFLRAMPPVYQDYCKKSSHPSTHVLAPLVGFCFVGLALGFTFWKIFSTTEDKKKVVNA